MSGKLRRRPLQPVAQRLIRLHHPPRRIQDPHPTLQPAQRRNGVRPAFAGFNWVNVGLHGAVDMTTLNWGMPSPNSTAKSRPCLARILPNAFLERGLQAASIDYAFMCIFS